MPPKPKLLLVKFTVSCCSTQTAAMRDDDNNKNANRRKSSNANNNGDDDALLVCCKHGRPCRVGLAAEANQRKKDRTYENIPKLIDRPLTSPTRSQSDTSERRNNGEQVSPSQETQYENIPNFLGTDEGDVPMTTTVTDDWDDDYQLDEDPSDKEVNYTRKKPAPEADAAPPVYDNLEDDFNLKTISDEDIHTAKEESFSKLSLSPTQPKPKSFENSESERKIKEATERRKTGQSARVEPEISETTAVTTLEVGDRNNPKERLTEFYLGPCTPAVAEKKCKQARVFRLYHRVADWLAENCLQSSLPLCIVFRTSRGAFRHVRILHTSRGNLHVNIEGEPQFATLGQLITFYDIYATFGNNLEPFPDKMNDEEKYER